MIVGVDVLGDPDFKHTSHIAINKTDKYTISTSDTEIIFLLALTLK